MKHQHQLGSPTYGRPRGDWLTWAAALLVPLSYLILYTPYGMDSTDFGYFYGYAWRILEGQIPYRDFWYIKPALPLYWHAFWLWLTPESWEVLGGKAGFVGAMLATSWLAAASLNKVFDLEKLGLPLPLLATCGFVWGVHSFPHMPWHTVDGILFASGGLWCAVSGWPTVAGLLAGCAMLCKQSYLFVPLGVVLLVWLYGGRWQLAVRALAGWGGLMLLVWCLLHAAGAFDDFTRMTTGQLDIREALDAGILIYLRQNWWLPALACLPWLAARLMKCKLPVGLLPAPLYLVLLTVWYIWDVWRSQGWTGYGTSWPTLFMLLGGLCLLLPVRLLVPWLRSQPAEGVRHRIWLARVSFGAALLTAWSVAISGGYKIPAFYAVPLLFALACIHASMGGRGRSLLWASLAAGLLMFWAGYQHPYVFPVRPLPRAALVHDAGQIYPKASGVLVDTVMYEKLEELDMLRGKYGPHYKTLPGFSFAYYLNGDTPVYPSDWLIDWEINGETETLYQELLDRNLYVFMERDQLDAVRADAYERAGYTVSQRVRHSWNVIETTKHFIVFQRP